MENDHITVKPKLSYRNYRCPKYDDCLAMAAKEDNQLYCNECSMKDAWIEDFNFSELELNGCFELLLAIFFPEAYREYKEEKRLEILKIRKFKM